MTKNRFGCEKCTCIFWNWIFSDGFFFLGFVVDNCRGAQSKLLERKMYIPTLYMCTIRNIWCYTEGFEAWIAFDRDWEKRDCHVCAAWLENSQSINQIMTLWPPFGTNARNCFIWLNLNGRRPRWPNRIIAVVNRFAPNGVVPAMGSTCPLAPIKLANNIERIVEWRWYDMCALALCDLCMARLALVKAPEPLGILLISDCRLQMNSMCRICHTYMHDSAQYRVSDAIWVKFMICQKWTSHRLAQSYSCTRGSATDKYVRLPHYSIIWWSCSCALNTSRNNGQRRP